MAHSSRAKIATRDVERLARAWGMEPIGANGGHSYMVAPNGTKVAYRSPGRAKAALMEDDTVARFAAAVGVTRQEFLAGPPPEPKVGLVKIDEKCARCKHRFAEDDDTHLCMTCLDEVTKAAPVEVTVYDSRQAYALHVAAALGAFDAPVRLRDVHEKGRAWLGVENGDAALWDQTFYDTAGVWATRSTFRRAVAEAAAQNGVAVEWAAPHHAKGNPGATTIRLSGRERQPYGPLGPAEFSARVRDYGQRGAKTGRALMGRTRATEPAVAAVEVAAQSVPVPPEPAPEPVEAVTPAHERVWMGSALMERIAREAERRLMAPEVLARAVVERWLDEHEGKPLL